MPARAYPSPRRARARALERTSECAAFAGTCVGWAPPHVELRLDQRATPRSGNGDGGGDGNELDAVGRLSQTRGPHVMLGYWGMPRETRAVLDADGWYGKPFDLNLDSVDSADRNAYCLCVNAGTTEHLMDQNNAFKIVHHLKHSWQLFLMI